MGEILVIQAPRQITFENYEDVELKADEVRLKTLYSGISAGTQLTLYRGVNPYLNKQWNNEMRIFEERAENTTAYPVKGAWGYEEVGKVIEVGAGVTAVNLGDIIYGTWSHKSTNIVTEEFAAVHKLPEGLDPIVGIYSQMGAIALNAILDADIHVGETVAVFGQGIPGQIAAQLAKLNGAQVITVDLDDSRLEYSKKLGADVVLNGRNCDVAKEIKRLTGNRGADICFEISGTSPALHEAVRSAAYNGKVVCSGFLQGGANRLYLGEEFHHNRINIVCSQISGINPELTYRWDRIRMEQTIMSLQKQGKLNLKDLITHVVSFKDAPKAYDMLDKAQESCLQVVLKF